MLDNPLTPEKARELLAQEKRERQERCRMRIEQTLAQERCTLTVAMVITPTGNLPKLEIIAQD